MTVSATPLPLRYLHSIGGCLDSAIGAHGLSVTTLNSALDRLALPLKSLKSDYANNRLPLLRLPEDTADVDAAEHALEKLAVGADTIVFFGTGGSIHTRNGETGFDRMILEEANLEASNVFGNGLFGGACERPRPA